MPRSAASTTGPPTHTVGSVDKALQVIEFVAASGSAGLSLTEVARALGTSKSTAYNLARTLVDRGYLRDVNPGPRYQLGFALVRLGDVAGTRLQVGGIALPVLREMSQETDLTSRVAVSDKGYPVFVNRVDGPGSVRFHTPLGKREEPHTSSAGKAILSTLPSARVREIAEETGLPRHTRKTITTVDELLADLDRVRARGYAMDDEEDVEGVFCVGAAFFDHSGACVGAVSSTGLKRDLPTWEVEQLGAITRRFADRISDLLGGPTYADALAALAT